MALVNFTSDLVNRKLPEIKKPISGPTLVNEPLPVIKTVSGTSIINSKLLPTISTTPLKSSPFIPKVPIISTDPSDQILPGYISPIFGHVSSGDKVQNRYKTFNQSFSVPSLIDKINRKYLDTTDNFEILLKNPSIPDVVQNRYKTFNVSILNSTPPDIVSNRYKTYNVPLTSPKIPDVVNKLYDYKFTDTITSDQWDTKNNTTQIGLDKRRTDKIIKVYDKSPITLDKPSAVDKAKNTYEYLLKSTPNVDNTWDLKDNTSKLIGGTSDRIVLLFNQPVATSPSKLFHTLNYNYPNVLSTNTGLYKRKEFSETLKYYSIKDGMNNINNGNIGDKTIFKQVLGSDYSRLEEMYNGNGKVFTFTDPTTGILKQFQTFDAPKDSRFEQPYISRKIGQRWGTGFSPGIDFIQGGIVTSVTRTAADVSRYAKFIASPKGLLWVLLQQGLQLCNPKVEFNGLIPATRIFNPIKIGLQIAGSAYGVHIERHGLLTSGKYEDYHKLLSVKEKLGIGENRLVKLHNELNLSISPAPGGKLISKLLSFKSQPIVTLSGLAGPGSVYGIGSTIMRKHSSGIPLDQSNDFNRFVTINPQDNKNSYQDLFYKNWNENYSTRIQYSEDVKRVTNESTIKDMSGISTGFYPGIGYVNKDGIRKNSLSQLQENTFRTGYQQIINNASSGKPDTYKLQPIGDEHKKGKIITVFPIHTRNKLGNQTLSDNSKNPGTDLYTRHGIQQTGEGQQDSLYKTVDAVGSDFVKVRFYTTDTGTIQFRGYISGLNKGFNADWGSVQYIGRPDSVYRYKGVKRELSFNLKIVAESRLSLPIVYAKLDRLSSLLMPDWNSHRMNNPICRLQLGGLIPKVWGFIPSLKYDIPEVYPWDLEAEVPMYIDASISFTVIGREKGEDYPKKSGYTTVIHGITGNNGVQMLKKVGDDIIETEKGSSTINTEDKDLKI